jgi:hypothetical protein
MCQAWKDKVILEQWEEGLICSVYKKYQLKPNNCGGATLLTMGYSIFCSILYEWLQLYVGKIVRNYHCGY